MSLSDEFFARAQVSYKLSVKFISDESLKDFEETCIREIFHTYELLMKAHISREHPLLLCETNNLFKKDKKPNSYDSLYTKAASELVDILAYIKKDDSNFSFLLNNRKAIEKMRSERNSLEHSSKAITEGFKGLILAPFVTKILKPLFLNYDLKMSTEFTNEKIKDIFDDISDFSELVPDKNRFILTEKFNCPSCDWKFGFISKSKNELFCVICDEKTIDGKVSNFKCFDCNESVFVSDADYEFQCADCGAESPFFDCFNCGSNKCIKNMHKIECPECTSFRVLETCPACDEKASVDLINGDLHCYMCITTFLASDKHIGDKGCECGSEDFFILKHDTGRDEAYCLSCKNIFNFWECQNCKNYFSGEKSPSPKEYRGNCCENCSSELFQVYQVQDD